MSVFSQKKKYAGCNCNFILFVFFILLYKRPGVLHQNRLPWEVKPPYFTPSGAAPGRSGPAYLPIVLLGFEAQQLYALDLEVRGDHYDNISGSPVFPPIPLLQ